MILEHFAAFFVFTKYRNPTAYGIIGLCGSVIATDLQNLLRQCDIIAIAPKKNSCPRVITTTNRGK